ncbi:DNA-binding protein [Eubacterium limosum]|uniref:DNA-binding protein n=1 Tax=Eubacterium limosum TaxID=1736 RepID=A0ABT5UTM4_EUBLI|nr:DNA-binding protein [Eubacterium limosum]MDE1472317.1 DNA-binding protein [Eubacterium limosum]
MASSMINVHEVMELLQVSESKAYNVIKQLNTELKEKGYITIAGKVSRKYFNEKFYGYAENQEG